MRHPLANRVLAHRGHWSDEQNYKKLQKNSLHAISRAAELGFGLETDIRDFCGQAVISHDPALSDVVKFSEIIGLTFSGIVALNVKADGLIPLLMNEAKAGLPRFEHFYFDMSFPESMKYRAINLPLADRKSDLEQLQNYNSGYVWVDSFKSDWYLNEVMLPDKPDGVKVVVVSPELHNRPYLKVWKWLAKQMLSDSSLHICTDYPLQFLELIESS